jgi:sucrose phosphorylase
VPGIYIHSLFGSRSYHAGVEQTGRYRSINREKFQRNQLEQSLANPSTLRHQVFYTYLDLIRARAAHRAFHPNGPQQVLSIHPALFILLRTSPEGDESVLCIHNVSGVEQSFSVNLTSLLVPHSDQVCDLITGATLSADASSELTLSVAPYQILWLAAKAA